MKSSKFLKSSRILKQEPKQIYEIEDKYENKCENDREIQQLIYKFQKKIQSIIIESQSQL